MELLALLANVSWLSVILFLAGICLIVAEMFDPGVGFFGITGIICFIACIIVTAGSVMQGVILTAFTLVILAILFFVFLALMSKGRLPGRLVLRESTSAELGFSGTDDMRHLMGRTGVVVSICRPVGNVDFDGMKLEVVSRGEYIEKGTQVEIIEIEGNRIVVKAK